MDDLISNEAWLAGHAADGTVTIRIEGFSTIYSVDEFMAHLEETDA